MTKKLMAIAILIGAAFAFGAGLGIGSSSAADAYGASVAAASVSADESAGERMVRLQREMDAVWDNFGYDPAASAKIVLDKAGGAVASYSSARAANCEEMEARRRDIADVALSASMAAVCAE